MIKAYRIVSIAMLLFNGIGAIYGGLMLILDPSGEKLQLPAGTLENSPFDNYLIPGILLFIVNGVFSLITLYILYKRKKNYPQFIVIQGFLLAGWITIQVEMIQQIAGLHILFGLIGMLLMICGGMLYIHERHQNTTII